MPNPTYKELRTHLDGSDPFMTGGHQVLKPRSNDKKRVPEWALDDKEVQRIVLRSFPKYATDRRQRQRAARWIRIIHLYFRMGMTRGQVADEIGVKPKIVRDLLLRICRVAVGKRADNRALIGARPVGRPKKIHTSIQTSLGSDEKPNILSPGALVPDRTDSQS
jgi:hypothetical protein